MWWWEYCPQSHQIYTKQASCKLMYKKKKARRSEITDDFGVSIVIIYEVSWPQCQGQTSTLMSYEAGFPLSQCFFITRRSSLAVRSAWNPRPPRMNSTPASSDSWLTSSSPTLHTPSASPTGCTGRRPTKLQRYVCVCRTTVIGRCLSRCKCAK